MTDDELTAAVAEFLRRHPRATSRELAYGVRARRSDALRAAREIRVARDIRRGFAAAQGGSHERRAPVRP